jgi:hypothetical protein
MDARSAPWQGGPGQNLPTPVLRDLAAEEVRRLTRTSPRPPRHLLLLAMDGFMRWCVLERGIKDGHGVTPSVARDFRVMLRRSGVKRQVSELHRDASTIVLGIIAANRGVWHPDAGDYLLYVPTAGEIWERPEHTFGKLYLSRDDPP